MSISAILRRALAQFADLRGQVLWIVIGGLVVQFGLGYGYAWAHVLRDITTELDWSRTTFATARVPLMLAMAIASPLVGFGVVRFGARPIMLGSVGLLVVAIAIQSNMQTVWHFWLGAAVQGVVGAGVGDVVVGAVVSRWLVRGRGLALGIVYAGANVAGFLISLALPRLAVSVGWRDGLLISGLAGALMILPFAAWVLREPRPSEEIESLKPGETLASGSDDDLDIWQAARTRSFWILCFVLFVFFFVFVGALDHLVASFQDSGMERVHASDLFALIPGAAILSKIGFGLLADFIDYRKAMLLQMGVLAASTSLLFALPLPVLTPIVMIGFGVSTAARDVVYPLIIDYCFGRRYLAQIYGSIMGLLFAGGLGTLFAGAVYDTTGSYQGVWHTYGALTVLAFLACFGLRDERRD